MKTIILKLPVINEIKIKISDNDLADFTARQLNNYVQSVQENQEQTKADTISADIDFDNPEIIESVNEFFNTDKTLARKIKIRNKELKVRDSLYKMNENTLSISSSKHIKVKWYKKLKKTNTYANLHWMFYELILYPIFSLYCIFDGYYLLHGSLISVNKKNILITGLDGVGKSSISNELQKNGEILSDNFVLYNGINAVPLNLAIRLEPEQNTDLKILYKDGDLKEAMPPAVLYEKVKPDKLFVLSISEELQLLEVSNNLTALCMFLNNAPEIGSSNNFLTPFLYNALKKDFRYENINYYLLEIPKGKIKEGAEVLLNEC